MFANNSSGESTVSSDDCLGLEERGECCSECGESVTRVADGERVCDECGLVIDSSPLSRRRARVFDSRDWETKRQTGGRETALRVDRGLGVGVGSGHRDGNGNVLSISQRNRVRTGHWGNAVDTGTLGYALGELQRVGAVAGIPEPEQETAAKLYRRASEERLVQGRTIEGFVCACLLIAARESSASIPLTSERLLAASRLESEGKITNARTALVREFDDVKLAPASPQDYVVQIANAVGASNEVLRRTKRALEVYQREEGNYRGTNPKVTAAVSLHATFDKLGVEDRPTLDELGRAAGVNPTTISKRKSSFVSAAGQ